MMKPKSHVSDENGFLCGTKSTTAARTSKHTICRRCERILKRRLAGTIAADELMGLLRETCATTMLATQTEGLSATANRREDAAYRRLFRRLIGRHPTRDELYRDILGETPYPSAAAWRASQIAERYP
jgi:hypothetical protein